MNYLRALFFNFLIVFFVNRVVPGIQIENFEEVPNIGADILFALIVGFFNASIFFFLALLELKITLARLLWISACISFCAFSLIAFVPFGVRVVDFAGWLLGGGIVWICAAFTNYLEWKHYAKNKPQ